MSIDDMLKDIRKKKIDVGLLSEDTSPCTVSEWISTGCLALDRICGNGIPVGRVMEIYGDEATGKTLIAEQIASVAQQEGHIVAYVDTETAVSKDMMQEVGVDIDKLIYASPDTVEEVFKFFDAMIESKRDRSPETVLVLIWDSIAATSSMREMEKDYGQTGYLEHARIISQGMRKIMRMISEDKVCLVLLNQIRENIGVMYGPKETTFGGKAVKFAASIRIQLSKAGKIKTAGKKIIGVSTQALVTKNRLAPPFQETILPIYFGHGIDDAGATRNYLKAHDLMVCPKGAREYIIDMPEKDTRVKSVEWETFYEANYPAIEKLVFSDSSYESGEVIEEDDADTAG
jgi:recombination protein RecA